MSQLQTNAVESIEVTQRELDHRKLAREAAAESIVLLRNDGALPLSPCALALYGAGAATTIKGGTGSGEVNERYSVTIEQGLIEAGFSITTDAYLREYEALLNSEKNKYRKNFSRKMLFAGANDWINIMSEQFQYPAGRAVTNEDILSSRAEVCVYVIARQGGECADRKLEKFDFTLTQTEIDNLKLVSQNYKKTIVVINAGGQMDISPLDDIRIGAVIYFCQQGMEGGNAFADILTGAATPSGCLSSTWPQKYEDWPNAGQFSYLKGHVDFEEYKEGIFVGYRYFDSFGVKPRYEFGYGLSYTGFRIETLDVAARGEPVEAKVRVTNTGERYAGKKTVQLYLSAPRGRLAREHQSLMAFAKTGTLAPGESQELTLMFSLRGIAGYDEETASYILEQGDYIVRIGESSASANAEAVITLDREVVTEVCMNMCRPLEALGELDPGERAASVIPENIRRIYISGADIGRKSHSYILPEFVPGAKAAKALKQLSTGEMIKVVCGTGMTGKTTQFKVQGAAAYTTSGLEKKGVPNAALCDGPAGLRLQRRSVRLQNGDIKPVDAAMDIMEGMPRFVKKLMLGDPDKGTMLYQHASAFPVGTAMAQTWNTELVERVGKAIGAEMSEFGVTFWLAPGMNIHRNPLCGRNYEYYSEDPLLTGRMAAAVTRGVQSFEGCFVTIKHFAANNQEDNRNRCDSRLSERALREIYLKGYRIAIEEGGARAIMTSYNKLNGVYTPNSYDLCTNLLRCEWGFGGVVMTDWFSTGKGLAGNGEAIRAGNDLIMPGGNWYVKMLKGALVDGTLKRSELRLSCARVLEAVMNGRTGIELGNH